jgi:glucokinase
MTYSKIILAGDIGGTNANFCIADISKNTPKLYYQSQESTRSVTEITTLANRFLEQASDEGYTPTRAVLAIAGPVEVRKGYQRVKMTNTNIIIDSHKFIKSTGVKKLLLMNDFDAISFATNVLRKKDYIILNKGKPASQATKAVLGAGTGLGKNILYFNINLNAYVPIPSEGGNSDLPLLDKNELEMAKYIKRIRKLKRNLYYEDILSGLGLESLYKYLRSNKYKRYPKQLSAQDISLTRTTNKCSNRTFELFVKYFSRCARNFALDTLSRGGLYIAGGIAAKNPDAFGEFRKEFVKNEVYGHILRSMPVFLITNPNVGLIGAAYGGKLSKWVERDRVLCPSI